MAFWEGIIRGQKDRDNLMAHHRSFDGAKWAMKPLIASLMLTYGCNLSCVYCPFQNHLGEVPESHMEDWEKLLERLASAGVRRISFSGGEPLLYPSLGDLINIATELGISKGVVTNGTLLTRHKLEAFAASGLDALTVSIDTVDENMYSRLCSAPTGTLPRVLGMVITARRLGGFWTGINTVITSMNVKMIGGVMDFCSIHDIPVQFQIFNPHAGNRDLVPGADKLKDAIDLIHAGKKAGVPVLNSEAYPGCLL